MRTVWTAAIFATWIAGASVPGLAGWALVISALVLLVRMP